MQYSAISIQGNIFTSDLLEKVRSEDIRYQNPADFGLNTSIPLRDEIGIAWAAAKAHWQAFRFRRERLEDTDTGTSETRQGWMLPFMGELGYDLEKSNAEIMNGKSYAISHRAVNRDRFPVHIVGINQSLDTRAERGGARVSPHALAQEYLNNHDHLYALVSNGRYLRLLRDATRLSRLSFLECDLERMMEDELFAEFALLFRILHATRMPERQDSGEESVIEFYHQESLASGSRIRERLSEAVEDSLKLLANGLLKYSANEELRQSISEGRLTAETFYLHLLRLVYRMLFLLVIEERHLIYPKEYESSLECQSSTLAAKSAKAELSSVASGMERSGFPEAPGTPASGNRSSFPKQQQLYYRFYSINRLTQLAEQRIYVDPRKTDLWRSLFTTFRIFENAYYGEKLGIKPLGSGLFAPNALGDFGRLQLDNGTLLNVLFRLVTFEDEKRQRVRVNYADLDVEEFGSVYEGLLEYDAEFRGMECESSPFASHSSKQSFDTPAGFGVPIFVFVKGEARSSSGSHYTPEELVKPLIEHSLEHLIQQRLLECESSTFAAQAELTYSRGDSSSQECQRSPVPHSSRKQSFRTPEEALLSLKIADVACGSGHILLSAARRIGLELARVRSNEDQPSPPVIRQATRDVIRHCIYGVDKNPLAVELCKVALWLEAHNPGEPLNFLDHRIKCGDAIVGLAHKEELKNGIANEAFKKLPGDEKEISSEFSKRNRKERKSREQFRLNFEGVVEEPLEKILEEWRQVDGMPESTPDEIKAKHDAYTRMIGGEQWWKLKTLADIQTAQFFLPKTKEHEALLVTDAEYREYLNGSKSLRGNRAAAKAEALAVQQRFFHYFLQFPEVFVQGGFDCVLGNPPYLGGRNLTANYGFNLSNYIKVNYPSGKGNTDLVAFFALRAFGIIKFAGFEAFITTKTIYQGDTRVASLEELTKKKAIINFGIRSINWPGAASVTVCLLP